jgi:hypothetical protein
MWKLKNSDEYSVFANTRQQAVLKFKKDLGLDVNPKNLIRINF